MKLLPWTASVLLTPAQRDAADKEALGDVNALDKSVAAHIYTRAEAVLRLVPPVQLTSTSLLKGHPMGGAWPQIQRFLPEAAETMRKCVENNSAFQRRLRNAGSLAASNNADEAFAES